MVTSARWKRGVSSAFDISDARAVLERRLRQGLPKERLKELSEGGRGIVIPAGGW